MNNLNNEVKKPFIDSKNYPFKLIYKDKYFEVVVGEAQTNKGELSIGIRTNHFPKDNFHNNCYFIFPSHFGVEFLKLFILDNNPNNENISQAIAKIFEDNRSNNEKNNN